jgi:hypothetical protein
METSAKEKETAGLHAAPLGIKEKWAVQVISDTINV